MSELSENGSKLINALSDGEFHSGEKLGILLNVSRASVNNYIKGLQEIGLDIYKVQGRGYQCATPITLLDANKIKMLSASKNVHVEQIVDSTNQWLLDKIPNLKSGQTCVAEYQLAGRGRHGRKWVSPFASHIYFSYYKKFNCSLEKLSGLSLLVGIATVNALKKSGFNDVSLKWPNDIYYQQKKLAGILIELNPSTNDISHTVIGVGLNVKMPPEQAKEIDQPWIDLNAISEANIDRNELIALLKMELDSLLKDFEHKGLKPHIKRWFELDCFLGKKVNIIIADKITSGICRGIDESGAFLLEQKGKVSSFSGGEISLRLL